jgi:serine/threonine protein kinase
MELLEGGDLFDRIVERIRYTEDKARQVMFQILTALHYLHSQRVVHRYVWNSLLSFAVLIQVFPG